jgi:gamma-tubulin complex component 4
MTFVVDNLQYYLMADILESQFGLLLERLDQSSNFEELRHAHDIFLTSVIFTTFINNKPVNQCLTELLNCCLQYCRLIQVDPTSQKVEEISVDFSRQSSLLFKLLTSIKSRQTGSQLAQLLLRIDYNRYFSTHGHDIGRVTD